MQKIIFIFICLVFYNINAYSQITKDTWMIGGSAGFRNSTYNNGGDFSSKQTIVELSGDIGYFIIDKLAVGLKPGYNRTGTNNPRLVANIYEVGPFIRYYILPADKTVNIFTELSYQYGILKTNQGISQNSNNFSGIAGCAVFFNSSVALDFNVGYSNYKYNNNTGKVNSLIAGIGFHFHLKKD